MFLPRTETKSHTEIEESDDGHGNIVETEKTVTETFLYITVSHKTVDEMATAYGFNKEQIDYLAELLKDENNQLWSQVLYGIGYSDDQIVSVALSQVGNVEVSLTGLGTDLTPVWNGVLALFLGVLMSADILTPVLFRNMPVV